MPSRSSSRQLPSRRLFHRSTAALAVLALVGAVDLPWMAFAANVVEIVQKKRAFAVREITIPRGSTVRFTNADEFPHQIQTEGPGLEIDSPLQGPGETLDVAFPNAGTFEVTCGVHPRMRMSVHVQ